MSNLRATLATIHRLHNQIERHQREIGKGPAALKVGQEDIQKKRNQIQTAREQARRMKMEIDRNELALRSREADVEKLAAQLNQAKDTLLG